MKPLSALPQPLPSLAQLSVEEGRTKLEGDPHKGGRPIVRRQSLDNGSPEFQALRRQVNLLEAQVAQARAADDQNLVPGEFSNELYRNMIGQRRYEQKATADHFGSSGWTRMRQHQLARIPGGEVIAAQYGVSFAKDIDPSKPGFARLDINNPTNAFYQRLGPDVNLQNLCEGLLKHLHPQEPPADRLFVNSEYMAQKLVKRLLATRPQLGHIKMHSLAPGVVALTCADRFDTQALERLVDVFGGRISNYQVMRAFLESMGRTRQPVADPKVDVAALVGTLHGANPKSVAAQLRNVPEGLGTCALAHTAAGLIDETAKLLSVPALAQQHQHNPWWPTVCRGCVSSQSRYQRWRRIAPDSVTPIAR